MGAFPERERVDGRNRFGRAAIPTAALALTTMLLSISVSAIRPGSPEDRELSFALLPEILVKCDLESLSLPAGGANLTDCTITSVDGFSGEVDLYCDKGPPGVDCFFGTDPITPPVNGSSQTAMVVTADPAVPPGSYELQVNGENGSLVASTVIRLQITGPDFQVECGAGPITIISPGNATSFCTLTSIDGFSGPVDLFCSGAPPGLDCAFTPDPVTLAANATENASFEITVDLTTPPGSYRFAVDGTGGSLTRGATIYVDVLGPDFGVDCDPSTLNVTQGGSNSTTCAVTSSMNFSGLVTLTCNKVPPGANCTFIPITVDVPAGGSNDSTLLLSVAIGAMPGLERISVEATSGLRSHGTGIDLVIIGPDFAIDCQPAALSVMRNSTNSTECSVSSIMGFNAFVDMSCENPPSGVACNFTPVSPSPPPNGTANSTLDLNVSAGASPGNHVIIVMGKSGEMSRTLKMDLQVLGPEFTVACLPAQLDAPQGGSNQTICTVTSVFDFTGIIDLSCERTEPGVGCWFAPSQFTLPPNGTVLVDLTLNVSAFAPVGPGLVLILATGPGLSRGAKVELNIVASVGESFWRFPTILIAMLVPLVVLAWRRRQIPPRSAPLASAELTRSA